MADEREFHFVVRVHESRLYNVFVTAKDEVEAKQKAISGDAKNRILIDNRLEDESREDEKREIVGQYFTFEVAETVVVNKLYEVFASNEADARMKAENGETEQEYDPSIEAVINREIIRPN